MASRTLPSQHHMATTTSRGASERSNSSGAQDSAVFEASLTLPAKKKRRDSVSLLDTAALLLAPKISEHLQNKTPLCRSRLGLVVQGGVAPLAAIPSMLPLSILGTAHSVSQIFCRRRSRCVCITPRSLLEVTQQVCRLADGRNAWLQGVHIGHCQWRLHLECSRASLEAVHTVGTWSVQSPIILRPAPRTVCLPQC